MSINYDIKEHLTINNTELYKESVDITAYHLSLLGARLMQDRANVDNLTLLADGKEYHFEGDLVSEAYHLLVRALYTAKTVELSADYSYNVYADELDPGPFDLAEHLGEMLDEAPERGEGIFYSMYNHADCEENGGVIAAYGKQNGTLYNGVLEAVEVERIPDGNWITPVTALVCEMENVESERLTAIVNLCQELSEFSDGDNLDVTEDGVSFFLNNLTIDNDAQLKAFIAKYVALQTLTDHQCALLGEMVDLSGMDAKMFFIDMSDEGDCTIQLAALTKQFQ